MITNENNLKISDMLNLSYKLWEKHSDTWAPMKPEYAETFIFYLIEEIGESIAIIKKKGEAEIMNTPEIKEHFVEELGDVLMYFMNVLNRFNMSHEEFSKVYLEKF